MNGNIYFDKDSLIFIKSKQKMILINFYYDTIDKDKKYVMEILLDSTKKIQILEKIIYEMFLQII